MKTNKKVYSTSDFINASASVLVESCFWIIDDASYTNIGEFSRTPLFELQLRRYVKQDKDTPEGLTDMSYKMTPNRTYVVREGRPLYNEIVPIWESCDEDPEVFRSAILNKYNGGGFIGRVERLSGVNYQSSTRRGTVIQRTRAEYWYPDDCEASILDDFIFLCNKGVYTPIIEKTSDAAIVEKLKNLDPEVIAAIKAMK